MKHVGRTHVSCALAFGAGVTLAPWGLARGAGEGSVGTGEQAGDSAGGASQPAAPLDSRHADVNSLSTSLQVRQPDLAIGQNFEHVYANPDGHGGFYRQSGGLIASFDHSEYVRTREGTRSVIPAGTVFSIGPPGPHRFSGSRSDGRAHEQGGRGASAASEPLGVPAARMVSGVVSPLIDAGAIRPGRVEPHGVARAVGSGREAGGLTEAASPETGETTAPLRLDISSEYYRRYRLRQISARYAEAAPAAKAETPIAEADARGADDPRR